VAPSTCFVCVGKDCRKAKGYDKLRDVLDEVGDVREVRCQKVCKGPVAGARVHGHLEWFGKLRKGSQRKALAKLVRRGGGIPEALEGRRERKRRDLVRG
jgi:hypothetical protein